jgi:predicted TIM-barrel fold metal-dependent hydrolase
MAMLAMPQKRTGRLDLGNALAAWLRGNTGPHVHQSPGAAVAVAEASRLREFIAEPLGTLEDMQDKSLRCCSKLSFCMHDETPQTVGHKDAAAACSQVWILECRYYHFLTAMEAALPVGQDRRGVPVSFAWHDAFSGATYAST